MGVDGEHGPPHDLSQVVHRADVMLGNLHNYKNTWLTFNLVTITL